MRRGNDTGLITIEDKVVGVNLGFDFCAEHEWGIDGIQRDYGIDTKSGYGFGSRKNTLLPDGLKLVEGKTDLLLHVPYSWLVEPDRLDGTVEGMKKGDLSLYGEREIACGWSSADFGIHATRKHRDVLRNLYDAFQTNNGVITLSGRTNPFANSGLLVLDYRLIPDTIKAEAETKDKQARDEQAMYRRLEQESGVLDLLKAAEKSYLYLGIKRLDENGQPMWWLNGGRGPGYYDAYGWYTTDALKAWAEEKGPVVERALGDIKEREASRLRDEAMAVVEAVEITPQRIRRTLYNASKSHPKKPLRRK